MIYRVELNYEEVAEAVVRFVNEKLLNEAKPTDLVVLEDGGSAVVMWEVKGPLLEDDAEG